MNLIVNQMMQLQIMHVSDRNRAVEIFAGTSVAKPYFTVAAERNSLPQFSVVQMFSQIFDYFRFQGVIVFILEFFPGHVNVIIGNIERIHDIDLVCTIEYRSRNVKSKGSGRKA